MSDLKPTEARLRLLKAVADNAVTAHRDANSLSKWTVAYSQVDRIGAGWPIPVASLSKWLVVTARVNELADADWIRLGPQDGSWLSPRQWEITPAGQAVLDAA